MKFFICILCWSSLLAQAQVPSLPTDEEKSREREMRLTDSREIDVNNPDIETYPEIYQSRDSLLQNKDSTGHITDKEYITRSDGHRMSISYTLSLDYEEFSKIQSLDFVYMSQFNNSYQNLWWGFLAKTTTAQYSALADERVTTASDPESVANISRREELQNLSSLGVGLGYRFKALSEAFNTDRIFEFTNVFVNYVSHLDNTDQENYSGYGYTAEYLINRRASKNFVYGLKLSYNWALLTRSQADADQQLSEKSLVFGWTSWGLEFGYVF